MEANESGITRCFIAKSIYGETLHVAPFDVVEAAAAEDAKKKKKQQQQQENDGKTNQVAMLSNIIITHLDTLCKFLANLIEFNFDKLLGL